MKRSRKISSIVFIIIVTILLLCGCSTEEKTLSKEEKAALKEVTENTYTIYEVQAAITATTMMYQEGRKEEVHVPLVVEIVPGDKTLEEEAEHKTWWYGGPYGYNGTINVRVYESHETHNATLGYYEIDCSTWIGKDSMFGKEIDLRGALAGLTVSPGWTQ